MTKLSIVTLAVALALGACAPTPKPPLFGKTYFAGIAMDWAGTPPIYSCSNCKARLLEVGQITSQNRTDTGSGTIVHNTHIRVGQYDFLCQELSSVGAPPDALTPDDCVGSSQ